MNVFEYFAGYIPNTVRQTFRRIVARDVPTIGDRYLGVLNADQMADVTLLKVQETYNSQAALLKALEPYRNYYLVEAILDAYIEEALATDPTTHETFRITASQSAENHKEIQGAIDDLCNRFDLEAIVKDVALDALFNGDYSFRLEIDENGKEGIKDITDTIMPGTIVALHRKHIPIVIYEIDGMSFLEKNPWSVWHISMAEQKIRMPRSLYEQVSLPYHLRVGKPMFRHLLPQLRELKMMEVIDVAKDLSDLLRNSLVSVQMQHSLDPKQAKVVAAYYEKMINKSAVSLSSNALFDDASAMIVEMAKIKVIPKDDQRGEVSPLNVKEQNGGDRLSKINDKRQSITSSTGVPFQLVFDSADGGTGVNARQYARFQKKIRMIQGSCAFALRNLVTIHAAKKGIEVEKIEDILVQFTNSINTTEIDSLDFVSTKIEALQRVTDYLNDLREREEFGSFVRMPEVARYIDATLKGIKGAENIIDVDGKQKTQVIGQ